ncbi:MAG: carbohydrate kinase family protein [Dongiaceae bacterium]
MRPLAIIGNVNVDIIVGDCPPVLAAGTESLMAHGDIRPAGCVGNTALAWIAMKVPFQAAANTGDDMLGDWLRGMFPVQSKTWPRESCATTFSVGIGHPDSERTFLTTRGHLSLLDFEEVQRGLNVSELRGGLALVVGTFLTERLTADYDRLFGLLCENDIQIALDTGWPIDGWTTEIRARCLTWLTRCDHLLLNEVELLSLFDVRDIAAAMNHAAAIMPPDACVVAKRGPLGASGLRHGHEVQIPAPSVAAIDTAGAGDIFNAGYLAGIAQGASLHDAVAAGVALASRAISTRPREYTAAGIQLME